MIAPRPQNGLPDEAPKDASDAVAEPTQLVDQSREIAPEESVYVFPATLAQRRFWLLDKLQPGGNPALNMALPTRLHGPLDHAHLRRALNDVITRHEALRTTFVSERGELRQLITPTITLELPVQDARHLAPTDHEEAANQAIREDAQTPFDLEVGPLIRARLVQFSEREHLLLLTVHHIVTDGWSNGVLIRELCAIYGALVENKEPSLPALEIQFADYADWQHERIMANDFSWQREYWRQQLSGDLPVLDLPTDRPRLKTRHASGDVRSRMLAPELVAAAKALATREGASPFMLFMGVFQVLLHRYTGQPDFLVTSPSANRERQEFEPLIGLFVNLLLLRADLRDDPTFSELLGRVRRVALDAFVNQDVPFELLLDEFQPSRLQVNFLYQSAFVEATTLPAGLTVEPLDCVSAGTVYELNASVFEDANNVRLELEYNSDLFEPETIDRMLGHYVTLLESVVADPAQTISMLSLLTREERAQLEPTAEATSIASAQLDVRAPLVSRVMAKTDAMAVRHGKREMSCAELLARMENARNAVRDERAPSDLDQAATWVGHWRARLDVPVPNVTARSPEADAAIAVNANALRESIRLRRTDRVASFSLPGIAATEELGAALFAETTVVYPTPELLAESAGALATWLERENISVAFLPAATWNRLAASFGRKVAPPANLRLVIATEGAADEGSFGRISEDVHGPAIAGVPVYTRSVVEGAGTLALNARQLSGGRQLRVLDPRTNEPIPIGVVGELAVVHGTETTRLGELARRRPDGALNRLGRVEEQVCVRGFRVDLRRIEDALCALPGIRHAIVRPLQMDAGIAFIAYILPNLAVGSLPNEEALRRLLREKGLSDEFVPAAFVRLKEIPLRATDGRLDVTALPPAPAVKFVTTSEPVRPYLGLQLQLIAIWEEVLGVRGIGIRDDFFDLGGNSLLAMRMLQRAELACGKEILPTALFANPTIEHLAGEMARDVLKDSPTLLRVHDAGKRTPFFYLHGDLSGGGFYSLKLSRALGQEQPFYAMPPQDIRALPAAPSIEEMAAAHLAALREVRPNGPYVIGGFCVGGLVAYELAQQIVASGEKVEMLLVIDWAPEDRALRSLRSLAENSGRTLRWNDNEKVAIFGRWALWRTRLAEWSGMKVRAKARVAWQEIRNQVSSVTGLLRPRVVRPTDRPAATTSTAANIAQERDLPSAFLWASAGYRPQPYQGPAAILVSEDVLRDGQMARDWKELAPQITVHPLTGSHLECITAHVDTLAETIESCLQSVAADGAKRAQEQAFVPLPVSGNFPS